MKNLILTGGGTAGHVTPFFAVTPYIKKNAKILFVGSENGIERSMVDGTYEYTSIPTVKLIRGVNIKNLLIPFKLSRAVKEAKKILTKAEANLVFSKGGYVALPVVLAAFSLKIPVVSHESDFSPGLTTKIAAKKSALNLATFSSAAKSLPNGVEVGPIVGEKLLRKVNKSQNSFLKAFERNEIKAKQKEIPAYKPVILVFGGGSGSKKINEIIFNSLNTLKQNYRLIHVCGKNETAEEGAGYIKTPFVKDMAEAYSAADIVIARCGSNSAWEITARGLPAIYLPLKKATRGDQIENAKFFYENGAALYADEDELDEKKLLKTLELLYSRREIFSSAAKKLYKAGGAKRIAEYLNSFLDE